MNRRQRSGAALVAMLPVTIAAFALWLCGCGGTGLALEVTTALAYTAWVTGARE